MTHKESTAEQELARLAWRILEDETPPDQTDILIKRDNGSICVAALYWEHPMFEDTWESYRYFDNPYDEGQEWEWHSVVEWKYIE